MNLEAIKTRIKIHEGYRDTVYEDSLGKATIGYGHLVTYKDKFEELLAKNTELSLKIEESEE